jgi:glycerol-3-phosphate dehydrogenase
LFTDAKLAEKLAPKVAEMMMKELGRDETWKQDQITAFMKLANGYLLKSDLHSAEFQTKDNAVN